MTSNSPTSPQKLIEAYLFWKGEPVTISEISKALGLDKKDVQDGVELLMSSVDKHERGIVIVRYDDVVTLGTHPDVGDTIARITKEELQKELGKSSLETLAIILYQGPVKRSDIDYVRGVNSQFILRNLLLRGLIDRTPDPKDERTFVYSPSLDLLTYLGVTEVKNLPDFETVIKTLASFNAEQVDQSSKDKGEDSSSATEDKV